MLRYEYLWSQFALHSHGAVSFGGWVGTGLSIAVPWCWCITCLGVLRNAARNGKVSRDMHSLVSLLVVVALVTTYVVFAPEIHRLTSMGALR